MSAPSILMTTTSFPAREGDYRGGFVLEMARSLAHRGCRVRILCPHPGGRVDPLDRQGLQVIRTPVAPGLGPGLFGDHGVLDSLARRPWQAWRLPPALASLGLALRKEAHTADLLVSHWSLPCGLLGAALRRAGGPRHVLLEHGGGLRLLRRLPSPLRSACLKMLTAGTDHLHCVSPGILDGFSGLAPRLAARGFSLPMGVPKTLPAPMPSRGDGLRLFFAGRLIRPKGLHVLLDALSLAPGCSLTVAGDGPEHSHLEARARTLKDRVHFTGELPVESVDSLLAEHHAVVLPSLPMPGGEEGTPTFLLRALAAGRPAVASRTGGMASLLADGAAGLLARPGDARELASCLTRLQRGSLLETLSQGARKLGSTQTWPVVLDRWCAALK